MKHHWILLFTVLAGVSAVAGAGVIFSTGNIPQTDEPVLFHDSCVGCVDGPGMTVVGHLQSSNTLVDLTSNTLLTAVGPGHNTVSTDAGFDAMAITIPGFTYDTIIFQLTSLSTAADGTVTFTAHTLTGNVPLDFVSSALFDSHTGGNYYTITTTAGTQITELDISTTQLQHDISQMRIGLGVAIPEPSTFVLLLTGFLAVIVLHRRADRH
jgi:hypothetical protein